MSAPTQPKVQSDNLHYTPVPPTPFIQLTLAGTEIYVLVDTDSGLSLITDECRKSNPSLASQPISKSFVLAFSVTGQPLDILGSITALVHVKGCIIVSYSSCNTYSNPSGAYWIGFHGPAFCYSRYTA